MWNGERIQQIALNIETPDMDVTSVVALIDSSKQTDDVAPIERLSRKCNNIY